MQTSTKCHTGVLLSCSNINIIITLSIQDNSQAYAALTVAPWLTRILQWLTPHTGLTLTLQRVNLVHVLRPASSWPRGMLASVQKCADSLCTQQACLALLKVVWCQHESFQFHDGGSQEAAMCGNKHLAHDSDSATALTSD